MSRYSCLVRILDTLRQEGVDRGLTAKYGDNGSPESLNQARSRAYIHLFLKVSFGLLEFNSREHHVTDGAYDGGIDGYFISPENKTIFLIQSKFRTTEENFSEKEIGLNEILVMDIDRISRGEEEDERGNKYNGKILQLEREIRQIQDIARWRYKVVLLANLHGYTEAQLMRLTENTPVEVYNAEQCYSRLVFPVISGTFFNEAELRIQLDLSNKYAGTKISYTVSTEHAECEITVVFIPISEIAKILHRYRNSILRFNPRSYLELEGQKVNNAIRKTVVETSTNEFALFNNGITMLSDLTDINERIGHRNKAQLTVTNPQIINGGQTAYTLSRLYEELPAEQRDGVFANKEVLLKVITLTETEETKATPEQKADLIARISSATNQQTTVINADKFSNDPIFVNIQSVLFERYGLLFERKRGEFSDGLFQKYIEGAQIVERNLFFRLFLAVRGNLHEAVRKRLFMNFEGPERTVSDLALLDRVAYAFWLYRAFSRSSSSRIAYSERDAQLYAKIHVLANRDLPGSVSEFEVAAARAVESIKGQWENFLEAMASTKKRFWRGTVDPKTGKSITAFSAAKWIHSHEFVDDVKIWFNTPTYDAPERPFVAPAISYDPERNDRRRERRLRLMRIGDGSRGLESSSAEPRSVDSN